MQLQEVMEVLREVKPESDATKEWTAAVLGALRRSAEDKGRCVDPASSPVPTPGWSRQGEWLWDLTVSSYPSYRDGYGLPYYEKLVNGEHEPRIELVAECEWGDARSPSANVVAVMEDFTKLLAARAGIKVMALGFHERDQGTSSWSQLRDWMVKLKKRTKDESALILFGVGWDTSKVEGPELIQ